MQFEYVVTSYNTTHTNYLNANINRVDPQLRLAYTLKSFIQSIHNFQTITPIVSLTLLCRNI